MRFDILARPVKIGTRTAPNRLVNQPMECNDADASGNPTELTLERYRRLAEGGAGMITVESLSVSPRSRARLCSRLSPQARTRAPSRSMSPLKKGWTIWGASIELGALPCLLESCPQFCAIPHVRVGLDTGPIQSAKGVL